MKLYPIIYFLLFLFVGTACSSWDLPVRGYQVVFHFQIEDEEGHDLIDSLYTIGRKTTQADFQITFEQDGNSTTEEWRQVTLVPDTPAYIAFDNTIAYQKLEHELSGKYIFNFTIPALLGEKQTSVSANWRVVPEEEGYESSFYLTNLTINGLAVPNSGILKYSEENEPIIIIIPLQSEGLHLEVP